VSRQKARKELFLRDARGAYMHLSYPLIRSALTALEVALQDRREPVFRSKDNHYSYHGTASIVLLVAGFDAMLNELISHYDMGLKEEADQAITKKYYAIPKTVTGKVQSHNNELDLLIGVRHEIMHHYPGPIDEPDAIPSWFQPLQERGLFITYPNPYGSPFSLGWKLGSYRLCYWAWETISQATSALLDGLEGGRSVVSLTATEIERYGEVCPPHGLRAFDERYQLQLTQWE
jgi:hypothetical protein